MKTKFIFLTITMIIATIGFGQKVDYKNSTITVDGKNIATIKKIKDKETMGLTSTYEVYSMKGEKLIIAAYADEYEGNKNDNTTMYYRLSFLPTGQIGVFSLNSLGTEKSLAKLIGKGGIISNNTLDNQQVTEFIAKKGDSPKIAIDYSIVPRNRAWPVELKEGNVIEQNNKVIGKFADKTEGNSGKDYYEFYLPSEVLVAKVYFTGGNNAENYEFITLKDGRSQVVKLPNNDGKIIASSNYIDRNLHALRRIAKWLVENQYL